MNVVKLAIIVENAPKFNVIIATREAIIHRDVQTDCVLIVDKRDTLSVTAQIKNFNIIGISCIE